jgi:hypothetical protein
LASIDSCKLIATLHVLQKQCKHINPVYICTTELNYNLGTQKLENKKKKEKVKPLGVLNPGHAVLQA